MHSAVTYSVVAMHVCVLLYKHCSPQQSSVIILPACSLELCMCKCCAAALHCILELQLTCELLVVCLEASRQMMQMFCRERANLSVQLKDTKTVVGRLESVVGICSRVSVCPFVCDAMEFVAIALSAQNNHSEDFPSAVCALKSGDFRL